MESYTQPSFWKEYKRLPAQIRYQVRESYGLFISNPHHPDLHFKRVGRRRPIYSVRVSVSYQAIGIMTEGIIVWFWIGAHEDYERLLKNQ